MINLNMLQKKVHQITISLGYKHDKKNTIAALKRELKEFKKSKEQLDKNTSFKISNVENDSNFKEFYEHLIKGTNEDEIPDIIIVLMSHCQENGIDLETILKNKIRYNRLRGKKQHPRKSIFNI
jgi:NTP pyrophosphatase (non-canonical NTP hydrolase)